MKSVCTQGKNVSYYWRETPSGGHIEQTAEKVVQVLKSRGYILNGMAEADCEAQIESRLELAERGQLKDIEHVKRIQSVPEIDMFEIRWNHIDVMLENKASGIYYDTRAMIRLYYFEQGQPWVVGLHIHEKAATDDRDDERRLQNEEISKAKSCFEAGQERSWGVTELLS